MADQERSGTTATMSEARPEGDEKAAAKAKPRVSSGIQWWEACGGWASRYAMGTF